MATTVVKDPVERARLIRLGKLAANQMDKYVHCLVPHPVSEVVPPEYSSDLSPAAQKMLVVGSLLGQDSTESKELTTRASNVISHFTAEEQVELKHNSAQTVKLYTMRGGKVSSDFKLALRRGNVLAEEYNEEQGFAPACLTLAAWQHEELLGLMSPFAPAAMGNLKRNCAFCGARSHTKKVLVACTRCEDRAVYCDADCEDRHRKEHKQYCVEKVGEGKEA